MDTLEKTFSDEHEKHESNKNECKLMDVVHLFQEYTKV